jgi:hypothetical protein
VHDVLRPGGRVLVSGPYGAFTGVPGEHAPVLLLAGGSGLAHVRALAEAALRRRTHAPVVLFFAARTQRDLIDDEGFRSWQRRDPGFRYLRTLTGADGPPPAGRVPAVLGDWVCGLSGWRVYVAERPLRPVFIVPGATQSGAMPDPARAVIRRAEHHAVRARACGRPVADEVLCYLDRLSDLLFVLARHAAGDAAEPVSHY